MKNPALSIQDLTVAYQRQPVLWNINLQLPKGELIGVVGPNGAGKSTLIKAVMGLLPMLSGEIKVFGEALKNQRHLIGYVPQRSSVDWDFPTNALDVVMMGRYGKLPLFKRPNEAHREFALQCLKKLGIADYANRQISQLSGGQQQRVFLARALAQEAQIYLMDEPFTGVDAATEQAIIVLLRELKEKGYTVVVVHHDLQSVPEYFDSVVLLNQRLVAFGPTAETFTEEKINTTYGGRLNMLARVSEQMAKI
ncbi:MAG: manganese ABC transporter ATP-binding protein [Deltaproteobacteria bacterium CG_4_10_14_0_2_um_filter_43_8]|nr:MAG: manganese ABC transporter ATP-binding protein [Deltaproteobacteria bacterium CG11_big_fil_rev_8_21_14_0_20_42_23]PJA21487.1 MAG: manganese ABC transporter ATP-binding protein [Deltaproteobacteria bacterium CG_4_10_14_0_2_um_filter_43_8]PJC63352.1 MAG: manganese ABC transporter ATP-binding protein [Deltaproteobacteria bacterium CG_4_9_14_0_2_um_filter_42_21]